MKKEKIKFIKNTKNNLNKIKNDLKEYKKDFMTAAFELLSIELIEGKDKENEKEQGLAKY